MWAAVSRAAIRRRIYSSGGNRIFAARGVIHLVLQIEVLVLRENVGDVGHQLGLILDQGVRAANLFRAGRNALAAEHDGTHAQRRLAQIGNLHIGFEGPHAPALIFAHDKFQVIAPRREEKTGVVLHVLAADLLRAIQRELHGVALVPDGKLPVHAHLANDIDGGVVFVFFLHKGNLRAGDDERNRKIVVRIVLPEIGRAGVNRNVGLRQLRGEFVLYLLLAVRAIEVLEVAAGVIAGAIVELEVRAIQLHFQPPDLSIFSAVSAAQTQNVIGGAVFLHLRKDGAEIVGVEEGLAAAVRSALVHPSLLPPIALYAL